MAGFGKPFNYMGCIFAQKAYSFPAFFSTLFCNFFTGGLEWPSENEDKVGDLISLMSSYHLPFTLPEDSKDGSKTHRNKLKGLDKSSVKGKVSHKATGNIETTIVGNAGTTEIKVERKDDRETQEVGKTSNSSESSESSDSEQEESSNDGFMGELNHCFPINI